jgi:Chaperone of endosialidase
MHASSSYVSGRSRNLTVGNIECGSGEIYCASGNITGNLTVGNIKCGSGEIYCASGNITGNLTVGNIECGSGEIYCASGNITGNLTVGNIKCASGEIYCASGNITGNLTVGNIKCASGEIYCASGNITGNFKVQGTISGNQFKSTSDYRIKNEINRLDDTFTVDELKPVFYKNMMIDKYDIGLLAHELQEHYPYLVDGVKDGCEIQTVNYIGIIGILINEVKNIKLRLKNLEK